MDLTIIRITLKNWCKYPVMMDVTGKVEMCDDKAIVKNIHIFSGFECGGYNLDLDTRGKEMIQKVIESEPWLISDLRDGFPYELKRLDWSSRWFVLEIDFIGSDRLNLEKLWGAATT